MLTSLAATRFCQCIHCMSAFARSFSAWMSSPWIEFIKNKCKVTDKTAPPLLDWMSLTKQLHHCWIGCHRQSSSTTVRLDVTDKAAPPLLDWMSLTKQLHHCWIGCHWQSISTTVGLDVTDKASPICDLYKIMGNTACIAPLPVASCSFL